jgi:YebC/PmpR family DNA-binding regulatory protein
MAGHSKWANIKHKKERADKKKGKLFSKLTKEIINAVKQGGVDLETNVKLKAIIQKAKAANLSNDTIERNIKKASSTDQANYDEIIYELYGHSGVGIIVEVMTDNKNRAASDMRIALNKCGGSMASSGSVQYNFEKKGFLQINKDQIKEDDMFMLATESGADDFDLVEHNFIITTPANMLFSVKDAIEAQNIKVEEDFLDMVAKVQVECSDEDREKNEKLIEWLENLDDVDAVYHNMV